MNAMMSLRFVGGCLMVGLSVALLVISMLGFLNTFVWQIHGPGIDLGVVAGLFSAGAWLIARLMLRGFDLRRRP